MKVVFKVIKAGSGNDVYFERLSQALKTVNIESEIEYYHKYFQYFPWLLKFFNKKTPGDIIHSNVEYGWVFKEGGKPLYVTLHHNVFDKHYRKYISLSQKIFHDFILEPNTKKSLKKANKRIAVSQYTKMSFIKKFGHFDIDVIYNFIDTNKYKLLNIKPIDKRFKLLFVGNLTKRKGADLLPKIMNKLGDEYILYYTSGLRTSIPKEFELSNMKPLGKLSEYELIVEYNKCDALLFPSRLEGFGYAVAEAMACGKPAITTNTSSIPELISHNVNGFLCKLDDINGLVKKIIFLRSIMDYKVSYQHLNSQKIKDNFSTNIIIKQYENIYS